MTFHSASQFKVYVADWMLLLCCRVVWSLMIMYLVSTTTWWEGQGSVERCSGNNSSVSAVCVAG